MNTFAAKAALALFIVLMSLSPALAGVVGKFTAIDGRVDVLRPGEKRAAPVALGATVSEGDIVRTKTDSFAEITFSDDTVLKLTQSTRVEIKEYLLSGNKRQNGALKLLRGKVRATVSKGLGRVIPIIYSGPSTFRIETPTAVAGVKGTDFFVFYNMGATGVFVLEGAVDTMGLDETHNVVRVRGGEYTIVEQNRPAAAAAASRGFVISKHMKDAEPRHRDRHGDKDRERSGDIHKERVDRVSAAVESRRDGREHADRDGREGREFRDYDRDDRDFVRVSDRDDRDFSDYGRDMDDDRYYAERYEDGHHEYDHDYDRPISEINTSLLGSFDGVLATATGGTLNINADIEGRFKDDHTWWGELDNGSFSGGGSSTSFGGTMSGTVQNGTFTGTLSNASWDSGGSWSAEVTGTLPGGTFTGTLSGVHDRASSGDISGTGHGTWTSN
ncbi:MAG: FecR domain-containing protein [Deltaproteobacteria bacterium]|nr:FecR domain-containing protein [Deltaproteobacteria bacterium]